MWSKGNAERVHAFFLVVVSVAATFLVRRFSNSDQRFAFLKMESRHDLYGSTRTYSQKLTLVAARNKVKSRYDLHGNIRTDLADGFAAEVAKARRRRSPTVHGMLARAAVRGVCERDAGLGSGRVSACLAQAGLGDEPACTTVGSEPQAGGANILA